MIFRGTAALVFLMASWAGAAECAACADKKVCKACDGMDEAAVKAAQEKFKSQDLLIRREGIDRLVEAASRHTNAKSRRLTMEFQKMVADPEPTVKSYAAEKLGEFGEEATAVQVLSKEISIVEKQIPVEKPKDEKTEDVKKFEEQQRLLTSYYSGLAKSKSLLAIPTFDRGLHSASPYVIKIAAENCHGFKSSKVIVKGLVEGLAKFFSANITPGNSAAWTAISMALPVVTGCNDIPTQKDGPDASRWNAEWQKWYRANEKRLK